MRPGACVHYAYRGSPTGGGPVCAVGIDVEATFRPCWPCWVGNDPARASATCARYTEPTAEQLAQHEAEADAALNRFGMALAAITKAEAAGAAPGAVHALDCPACGVAGALRWQRTRRSLVAACSTPKCVEFRGHSR